MHFGKYYAGIHRICSGLSFIYFNLCVVFNGIDIFSEAFVFRKKSALCSMKNLSTKMSEGKVGTI